MSCFHLPTRNKRNRIQQQQQEGENENAEDEDEEYQIVMMKLYRIVDPDPTIGKWEQTVIRTFIETCQPIFTHASFIVRASYLWKWNIQMGGNYQSRKKNYNEITFLQYTCFKLLLLLPAQKNRNNPKKLKLRLKSPHI